eukprot:scaffold237_cov233-Pinguiococcus_pyrenoidosus.AAC.3
MTVVVHGKAQAVNPTRPLRNADQYAGTFVGPGKRGDGWQNRRRELQQQLVHHRLRRLFSQDALFS